MALGLPVSLDFYFFHVEEIRAALETSGFTVLKVVERDPYPEVEHQSRRAYLLCRS